MNPRTLKTVYYSNTKCREQDIVLTTRGSKRHEILPNIMRRLTQGLDNAVVVEAYDSETTELLAVVTYKVGEAIKVGFKAAGTPICITNIPEEA